MGEIADAMLNGDLDFETGEWLGEGWGFPRTARDMRRDDSFAHDWKRRPSKPFGCPKCGKRAAAFQSIRQHAQAVHRLLIDEPSTPTDHASHGGDGRKS